MRIAWALAAAVAFSTFSGCAMCQSGLDHLYPAVGGCCCHQADDCCRAGSAFCQDYGGGAPLHVDSGFTPGEVPQLADPVPDAPSTTPGNGHGTGGGTDNGWRERPMNEPSQLPSPDAPPTPPVDPLEVPDVGAFPQTDAPALPSLLPRQ